MSAPPAAPTIPEDVHEGEKKLTKAQLKALEKEAKKKTREAEEAKRAEEKAALLDKYAYVFGKAKVIQSSTYDSIPFVSIAILSEKDVDKRVTLRGRLTTARKKGKLAFIVLRDELETVQGMAAVSDEVPKEMVDFMGQIPCETVVEVTATVSGVEQPISSTTKSQIELKVEKIHVISEALRVLPFTLEDAQRPETADGIKVNFDTRLNCRWLDMRGAASNAIFRLQSRVGQYFRESVLEDDFVEIHTPKIISAASEGGANVFKVGYFNRDAYLAQSPQLYKQMAIQGDLKRVFEVAPVFRAENSNTHRHLTEFVGLDLEMVIQEHYFEVLDVAEKCFTTMFQKLALRTAELEAVRAQYPFENLIFEIPEEKIKAHGVGLMEEKVMSTDVYKARVKSASRRMLRIPYTSCIELLNTTLEEKLSPIDDINTTNEKLLGKLIKERYGVDWFISDRFPSAVRPFYTMPCPDDERFTNSFDMFIRGEEICSGAQRIHDADMLLDRAQKLGVDLEPVKDYVNAFRLGAWPHGGFGVGLERVIMLYLGLPNIRYASMFPRDPQRVAP